MTDRHDPLPIAVFAFQQAGSAAIIVSADPPRWRILDVNEAYLAVTRRRRADLVGQPLFTAFPESEATAREGGSHNIADTLERAMAGERSVLPVQRYDLPIAGRPGEFEENYWELSTKPLRDDAGTVVALLHEVENVTARERIEGERRRLLAEVESQNVMLQEQALELELTNQQLQDNAAELELQTEELQATAAQLEERTEEAEAARREADAAERRLRTVFAQAPAAVGVTMGPQHHFILVNGGYEVLVGRKVPLGKTFRDALPEIAAQGYEAMLDEVFRTGEPHVEFESHARLDKGGPALEHGWYDFVYQPLLDADGRVMGVLQQGIDVTDRVRAARALREREVQLRTLADAIPTLAWTARADGFIEWYNTQWYAYTGTTPEDMEGWGWQAVHHADTLPAVMREWTRSIESGQPFEMTFPLRGADGAFRRFLTRVAPVRNEDGVVMRWFGTNTDIEQEYSARLQAEEANEAKTTFLATMSHELRTPLNALGGYLDLLLMELRGPLTEAQRSDLERMRRSQHRLMNLINDILNFARIDSGRTEFAAAAVDVAGVLRRIEELVSGQYAVKGVTLVLEGESPPPVALVDEERLGQILLNILANAVKFTPPGGRVVASCARDGDAVLVSVQDTGEGIPSDKLDAIFDPFVQIGRRLNAPGEGVGLGLAISRALAEGMRGTLSVKSTLGAGSTFTLRLPAPERETPSTGQR